VGLGGDEVRVLGELHHFDQTIVGRDSADNHAHFLQFFAEVVVDFVAMAVPLGDSVGAVELVGEDAEGRGSTVIKRLDPLALEGWLEEYDLGQLYEKNVTGGGPQ